MLENSNLIEGKDAKELDKLITDYQAVTAQLNDLDTTKKKLLERIFELTVVGVNETGKFTFKINEQAGNQTISVVKLRESAPDIFGKVSALGLVNIGKSFKTLRSIKLKGDRV